MADDAANQSSDPATDRNLEQLPPLEEFAETRGQQATEPTPDPVPERLASRPPPARPRPPLTARDIGLVAAIVGISALIAVNVVYIVKMAEQRRATSGVTSGATSGAPAPQIAFSAPSPSLGVVGELVDSSQIVVDGTEPVFDDEGVDNEDPGTSKPEAPRHYRTVQEAASRSCTTASVEGLSRQIIGEVRCIHPNAFAPLPSRPNLNLGSQVFPYLAAPARDRLVRVLDAHRGETMTINSALRTVAQQYLVWRWSAGKRCGVQMASSPGDSNHESGLALDIAEEAKWRPSLEAADFHWLGPSDRVHFDYKGRGAVPLQNVDVLAFQRLWNRNFPKDPIATDGRYSPATEERLKKAPPDGFSVGPSCDKRKPGKSGT